MHLNVPAGIARTSFYDLLWWCVISGAAPLKRSTYHLSRPLPFGRTRKTNHADHAPLLPIISLICSPLCLRFLPALSFYYPASSLIVIVFFYPCRWCVFNFFSWCVLLSTLSWVLFLYLIIAHPCLPKSFIPCGKKAVLSRVCNLHYPTCSFYPLITLSIQLALVVYPLHKLTQTPLSPPNL